MQDALFTNIQYGFLDNWTQVVSMMYHLITGDSLAMPHSSVYTAVPFLTVTSKNVGLKQ
jgi:hypothetical protein